MTRLLMLSLAMTVTLMVFSGNASAQLFSMNPLAAAVKSDPNGLDVPANTRIYIDDSDDYIFWGSTVIDPPAPGLVVNLPNSGFYVGLNGDCESRNPCWKPVEVTVKSTVPAGAYAIYVAVKAKCNPSGTTCNPETKVKYLLLVDRDFRGDRFLQRQLAPAQAVCGYPWRWNPYSFDFCAGQ